MAHPSAPTSPIPAIASGTESAAPLADLAWDPRPEILVPITVAAALYAIGWWRLSRRSPAPLAPVRALFAGGGLACVAVALLSPIAALAHRLFVAHMVQHMLLIAIAAPALLLADPFPVVVWALPANARMRARRWLTRASPFGRIARTLTSPLLAWGAYAAILWLWHVPAAYEAALADEVVHDLEHLTFFVGAVLFWWPVIHPGPRFRRAAPQALRIVYLVFGAFQTAALGLALTLAPTVLYATYAAGPHPAGFGALDDQSAGGIVMWAAGGLVDMVAVLVLLYRSLGPGGRGGATPERVSLHGA
jgi:cytochrome c oxidase assembly factor CtaG